MNLAARFRRRSPRAPLARPHPFNFRPGGPVWRDVPGGLQSQSARLAVTLARFSPWKRRRNATAQVRRRVASCTLSPWAASGSRAAGHLHTQWSEMGWPHHLLVSAIFSLSHQLGAHLLWIRGQHVGATALFQFLVSLAKQEPKQKRVDQLLLLRAGWRVEQFDLVS